MPHMSFRTSAVRTPITQLKRLCIITMLTAIASTTSGQIGDVDPSFDTDGVLNLPDGSGAEYINAIDHAANGDLVITGTDWDVVANTYYVGGIPVWRRASNGSAVSSWGTNGFTYIDLPDGREEGQKIIAQPDGKVLIGGVRWTADSSQLMFVRLLSNGALDPSFGTGGYTLITGSPALVPLFIGGIPALKGIADLHLNSDGSYTAVGTTAAQGGFNVTLGFVLRLTSTGAIDGSFGANGLFLHGSGDNETFRDAEFYADGSILCGGAHNGSDNSWVKVTAGGSVDMTFGTAGVQVTPTSTTRGITSFVRDANGDLYANCSSSVFTEKRLVKFDQNGQVVAGYGTGGEVAFGSLDQRVEMDAQQRVVVWGRQSDNTLFIAQYSTSTGTELDYWPFYPGSYNVPGDQYRILAYDEDSNGNYVIGGQGFVPGFSYNAWSARVSGNGGNGFTDLTGTARVSAFPNPTAERITLRAEATGQHAYRLVIKDLAGRSVLAADRFTFTDQGTIVLDLHDLPQGSYGLHISEGDLTTFLRFVKY